MYRVTVGTQYGGEFYDESFDAPDWQTALIAAAEMAKWHCTRDGVTKGCGDCDGCRYDE